MEIGGWHGILGAGFPVSEELRAVVSTFANGAREGPPFSLDARERESQPPRRFGTTLVYPARGVGRG